MKEGELFELVVELSFPANPGGRSTHRLKSIIPVSFSEAERAQKFFAFHGVAAVVQKAGSVETNTSG